MIQLYGRIVNRSNEDDRLSREKRIIRLQLNRWRDSCAFNQSIRQIVIQSASQSVSTFVSQPARKTKQRETHQRETDQTRIVNFLRDRHSASNLSYEDVIGIAGVPVIREIKYCLSKYIESLIMTFVVTDNCQWRCWNVVDESSYQKSFCSDWEG